MATFEGYERRIGKIEGVLKQYGFTDLDSMAQFVKDKGVDVDGIVRGVQPIAFENAVWAYTLGAAIALKKGCKTAAEAATAIGEGLQAFCIPGSVADQRAVGLGHGNLGAMLLSENTKCFAFLAGHESFAAAEGAIGIARTANKVRKEPLRVILNGLGKDAAYIISRINGFTYVQTQMDYKTGEVNAALDCAYSDGEKAKVRCYGCDDVTEGVAIMRLEDVDVSITGNSTNPTRFQHPVAGTYKKWAVENGKKYFSVASGGGTGRTLHPDNMAAGPASYGMTDTMGRMHSDAQFAGSSSVPAHVEMMGLIGHGQQPHGRRDRGCGCGHRGSQQVSFRMKKSPSTRTGSQLVEKVRLRRPFPPKHVFPAPAARPGKRARKPCCARLPNPPHMSLDSEYSSEGCGPPNLPENFLQSESPSPPDGLFSFFTGTAAPGRSGFGRRPPA